MLWTIELMTTLAAPKTSKVPKTTYMSQELLGFELLFAEGFLSDFVGSGIQVKPFLAKEVLVQSASIFKMLRDR
jgi:hypothetical protein